MSRPRSLQAVRQDIDAVDEAIHDLIVRRTQLVDEVRAIKHDWSIKIQPSREAEILYRLVARHRGPFPKRDLCAVWRQLITATISYEGPFSVAIYTPPENDAYWDLARDHFGSFVTVGRHATVRSVIEAVRRQEASVGILPVPHPGDEDPWWRLLLTTHPEAPRVIGRLPFVPGSNARDGAAEALLICPVAVLPTGRDRSLLGAETEERLPLDQVTQALAKSGLEATFAMRWPEQDRPHTWLYLLEVDGFVTTEDPRIAPFRQALLAPLKELIWLGGYALPLTAAELATATVKAP